MSAMYYFIFGLTVGTVVGLVAGLFLYRNESEVGNDSGNEV